MEKSWCSLEHVPQGTGPVCASSVTGEPGGAWLCSHLLTHEGTGPPRGLAPGPRPQGRSQEVRVEARGQ